MYIDLRIFQNLFKFYISCQERLVLRDHNWTDKLRTAFVVKKSVALSLVGYDVIL